MNIKLHKHVVTATKVSFRSQQQAGDNTHPVMLSMSKERWLQLERPDTIVVHVTTHKEYAHFSHHERQTDETL